MVLLGALTLLLNRTMIGLQLRAAAADLRTARTLGVRANRVIMAAFRHLGHARGCGRGAALRVLAARDPDYGVSVTIFALVGVGARRPGPARDGLARRIRDRLRECVRR